MQLNDEPQSYYDILELTADATPQEIRSAYLRLKSSYSKDNIANYSIYSREETEQLLQKIEEAYLILANPERRRSYDLSHQGLPGDQDPAFDSGLIAAPVMPSIDAAPPITATRIQSSDPMLSFSNSNDAEMDQEWTGADLRRARESRRITLEDLADYTRISKAYLMAIEEDAYARLPAVVYVRGFLQQISRRLKLPTEILVKKYVERLKAARPEQ
jgi:curved DNA-binding protein CbpA